MNRRVAIPCLVVEVILLGVGYYTHNAVLGIIGTVAVLAIGGGLAFRA